MLINKLSISRTFASQSKEKSGFWARDDGTATVEAVIWVPIFAILLGIIINLSMVFSTKSQIIRVVQDGNRAFSLGRLDDAAAVEAYIGEHLAYLGTNMFIQTTVSGGQIDTIFSTPASELMPFDSIGAAFDGIDISVHAQHLIEF